MLHTFKRLIQLFAALAITSLGGFAAPASANSAIELNSQVFVERITQLGDRQSVRLESPDKVLPGDRLIFVINYRNASATRVSDFVITNPLPRAVAFLETLDGEEQVSIDGGNSWGSLDELRVPLGDGRYRAASSADVTHIRWKILQDITRGSEGKLTFRGVVK
ncbi:hypothetical protein [Alterisphingorhabdus coralli]|uniref:DUF11 domain-containing protein n=1 Tax=Alterisphingorhabdus coralli TaxID=3071408 RepID=A0AA97F7E6_9SPHN|nr:hypothetical protein [Parasphingorhabdus sp. SCSIO 66989]WOE73900.1 hypothetical protein RB602_08470 [Parasphingorhabdus sp. SCSIO 66989]